MNAAAHDILGIDMTSSEPAAPPSRGRPLLLQSNPFLRSILISLMRDAGSTAMPRRWLGRSGGRSGSKYERSSSISESATRTGRQQIQ